MVKKLGLLAFCVASMPLAFNGIAYGQTDHSWVGGGADNEFSTAANWDTNTVPSTGSFDEGGLLDNFRRAIGEFTIERSVDSATQRIFLNSGAVVNITGGNHASARAGASIYDFLGVGGVGVINQSAGVNNIGHGLRIGATTSLTSEASGMYNLTGGSLIISRGSNSILNPDPAGGRPSLELGSDSTLTPGDGEALGVGTLSISGTASFTTRAAAHLLGTGTFIVNGSSVTEVGIGSAGSGDGVWYQQAGGVLSVGLDAGGLTPILIDEVDGDTTAGANGDATFETGAILDPFDAGDANNAWTTAMIWEGTLTGAPTLSAAATSAGWEMQIVGNELQVRNPNFDDPVDPFVLGDFNGDTIVDCADLDGYVGNIGAAATGALAALDIDGDGLLSLADASDHVSTLVVTSNGITGTFLGDLNCDGAVTVLGDAFALVANLNNAVTTYAQGDLNFDGQVTVLGDAFTLVANLNMSNQ